MMGTRDLSNNVVLNYSSNISKEISKMIAKRLYNPSCNKEEFKKIASECEKGIKASEYDVKLSSIPNQSTIKNCKGKILW